MYLIFDATPVSKPLNTKAPFTETAQWPRLFHVSWIVLGKDLKPIEDFDCIVTNGTDTLAEDVSKWSRVDQEEYLRKATPASDILDQLNKSLEKVTYVFAHNLKVNEAVVCAEYMRQTKDVGFFKKERFCLMEESTYYCKLPSRTGGYKWPSLTELHATCFHSTYTPPNNARADVIAATRCFIKLMKLGQLEDLFEDD